jgi:hypothetical protein
MLSMATPFLCRLGFHKWRDTYRGPIVTAGFCSEQQIATTCVRCGKSDGFIGVFVFGGRRKGETYDEYQARHGRKS